MQNFDFELVNSILEKEGPLKVQFIPYEEVLEKYEVSKEESWWFTQSYFVKGAHIIKITQQESKPKTTTKTSTHNRKPLSNVQEGSFNKNEPLIFIREDYQYLSDETPKLEKVLYIYLP